MEAYNYKKVVIVGLMMVIAMNIFGSEPIMLVNGQALCRMTKEGLKACQPSVSGQNPLPPNPACCSALSNADLQCLCRFKDSGLLSFYGIDPDKAMALPVRCNIVQPSFHC